MNEAAKYKEDIVVAYSHVDNILEELDALEKAAPSELSRQSLQSYRRDYKTVRPMLSECCGLPRRAIFQADYDDFLYSYHHQPDLFDDDTDDDMDDNDDEDEFDYLGMEDDYNDYNDYFYEKMLNNIHYYSCGVVKESSTKEGVDYRYIIDKLKCDIGLDLEEWQLKDDDECRVVKKLEEFVTSKKYDLPIDSNGLCGLLKGNDNTAKPLVIEITATLNYSELGTTCIGYVASGEVAVGDTVKLNFNLGNGEHMPNLDDNSVLSANVTWIETNGKELTTRAVAGETLSLGLNVERFLLPKHIYSMESYEH